MQARFCEGLGPTGAQALGETSLLTSPLFPARDSLKLAAKRSGYESLFPTCYFLMFGELLQFRRRQKSNPEWPNSRVTP